MDYYSLSYTMSYIISTFIIICWGVGYFRLFKKTKQIENKKDRLTYALLRGIVIFLFPLILSPVIYCPFSPLLSLFHPLFSGRHMNPFFYIIFSNHFLIPVFLLGLFVILVSFIAGWIYAWFWLFKQTKQIEKKQDRFKYTFWRAIFLPAFLLLLPVCIGIFQNIFGVLLGSLLISISFVCWSKPPLVTYEHDETLMKRFLIFLFLALTYFGSIHLIMEFGFIDTITTGSSYSSTLASGTNK